MYGQLESEAEATMAQLRREAEFLFDPVSVSERLETLPELRAALGDPGLEGAPSSAYPQARRSPREIYRVLGNVHYEHLDQLLSTLERCIGSGFTQPTIIRTRGRKSFAEALAELHFAEHLLDQGFEVRGLDIGKGQQSVPDVIAAREGVEIAIEVYCPRAWEGLTYLIDDLRDMVKQLDVAFDYDFEVRADQLNNFGPEGLIQLHPGVLADALTSSVRAGIISSIADDLLAQLAGNRTTLLSEHEATEQNLNVSVALSNISKSRHRLPDRGGVISGPGITGYAPEAMFDRLVDRNVRSKARKRQAVGHAPLSLLVVDLSRSELTSELTHRYYRKAFLEILDRRLGPSLEGYDMIAFCTATGAGRPLQLHYLMREDEVSLDVGRELFGTQIP